MYVSLLNLLLLSSRGRRVPSTKHRLSQLRSCSRMVQISTRHPRLRTWTPHTINSRIISTCMASNHTTTIHIRGVRWLPQAKHHQDHLPYHQDIYQKYRQTSRLRYPTLHTPTTHPHTGTNPQTSRGRCLIRGIPTTRLHIGTNLQTSRLRRRAAIQAQRRTTRHHLLLANLLRRRCRQRPRRAPSTPQTATHPARIMERNTRRRRCPTLPRNLHLRNRRPGRQTSFNRTRIRWPICPAPQHRSRTRPGLRRQNPARPARYLCTRLLTAWGAQRRGLLRPIRLTRHRQPVLAQNKAILLSASDPTRVLNQVSLFGLPLGIRAPTPHSRPHPELKVPSSDRSHSDLIRRLIGQITTGAPFTNRHGRLAIRTRIINTITITITIIIIGNRVSRPNRSNRPSPLRLIWSPATETIAVPKPALRPIHMALRHRLRSCRPGRKWQNQEDQIRPLPYPSRLPTEKAYVDRTIKPRFTVRLKSHLVGQDHQSPVLELPSSVVLAGRLTGNVLKSSQRTGPQTRSPTAPACKLPTRRRKGLQSEQARAKASKLQQRCPVDRTGPVCPLFLHLCIRIEAVRGLNSPSPPPPLPNDERQRLMPSLRFGAKSLVGTRRRQTRASYPSTWRPHPRKRRARASIQLFERGTNLAPRARHRMDRVSSSKTQQSHIDLERRGGTSNRRR